MKVLGNIFQFYINSSIHVALGVVALSLITTLHFDLALDWELLFFVFFGTVTGYNFVKYAGIAKLHHRSLAKNLKTIQVFSFLSFIALLYYVFQVERRVLLIAGILGIFTLLYALPVFSNKRNLRGMAGLKVFVISFIWAGVSVLFPVIEQGGGLRLDVIIEFCQRFLFVLILILPFEIRDLKYDNEDLRTIPQELGVRKTKILGYGLIGGWILFEFVKSTATMASILAICAAAIFTALSIHKADEGQPRFFASFWVEGIPILWLVLLLLFEELRVFGL